MFHENKPQSRDPHRWVVFGIISAVYFFVFFHRVSTSVIAPDLLATFQTHATVLGLMSSMYFYAYALEQPLVGFLSDRLGPRKVVGYWSLAAAAGCVLFGLAPTIGWASVGRGLIGFGVGGVYPPAAYRDVFLVFFLITVSCLVLFSCLRKHLTTKHRKPVSL